MQAGTETQELIAMNSILVIDDHPLYCDALVSTLEQIFNAKKVKKATSLNQGLRLVGPRFMPDLVMLDLKLPDVTGLSGILKVKAKMPDVPVLVISAESSDEIIGALVSVGAAGFVPKDATHKVLKTALMEVRKGRRFLPEGYKPPANLATLEMSAQQIAQKLAELTPQQSRIMKLICAGKPNKLIAYEMSLAEATVKAHITALLRRLGVYNRTQAAILAQSVSLENTENLSDNDARALLS